MLHPPPNPGKDAGPESGIRDLGKYLVWPDQRLMNLRRRPCARPSPRMPKLCTP